MQRGTINKSAELLQKRCDNLAGLIDGEMRRYHLDNNTLANKSLMVSRTLYDRREHPEKFRLDELYRIMDVLGMKLIFVRKEGQMDDTKDNRPADHSISGRQHGRGSSSSHL